MLEPGSEIASFALVLPHWAYLAVFNHNLPKKKFGLVKILRPPHWDSAGLGMEDRTGC